MNELIGQFKEQGILDELGVGLVRDAFSELFYPGTSTIQTRARYLFFVPWIYQRLQKEQVPSAQVAQQARQLQIELIYALERAGEKSAGVIGIEARESLRQLPSAIYWNGLLAYGIRRFRGTREQYSRSLDAYYLHNHDLPPTEEREPSGFRVQTNWHPGIPTAPNKWLKVVNFSLTYEEAEFLRDRILTEVPGSLLAELLQRGDRVADIDAPWEDPDFSQLSETHQAGLHHAKRFSDVIYGSNLLYNLLLTRAASLEERSEELAEKLEAWATEIEGSAHELRAWDLDEFWTLVRTVNPRISGMTEAFVRSWVRLTLDRSHSLADDKEAEDLLVERERRQKRALARLSNPRALETWNGSIRVGRHLFRWPYARVILQDVLDGLALSPDLPKAVTVDA